MYCRVPMAPATVTLNDTLTPDFGTDIEKHHLKKQQPTLFFLFLFVIECMEWLHQSNMLGFFFLSTLELFVRVI